MAYGDYKYLLRRTASDKVLREKVFNIAKNTKYDGYQRGLSTMVYKFFDKRFALLVNKSTAVRGVTIIVNKSAFNNDRPLDLATQQLAAELLNPIFKSFKKQEFILHSKTIFSVLI